MGTQSDDKVGCVVVENGRRKGVCEDGVYSFDIQATDAAGNASDIRSGVRVERDTVRPERAKISLVVNKTSHTLDLNIEDAEIDSTALIKIWGNGQTWYYSKKVDSSEKLSLSNVIGVYFPSTTYTSELIIQDRAGNRSPATYSSVTTPADAFCVEGSSTGLTFPLRGNFVRSGGGDFYAQRQGNDGTWHMHQAQDFTYYNSDQPLGKPIYSAADGVVANRGTDQYGGLWVLVWHPSLNLYTFYLHFDQVGSDIQKGKNVDINTVLGTMGSTGLSTGPHLHFEVRLTNGTKVDPMSKLGECRGSGPGNSGGNVYKNIDRQVAKSSIEKRFIDLGAPFLGKYKLKPEKSLCGSYTSEVYYSIGLPFERERFYGEIIFNPSINKSIFFEGRVREKYYDIDKYCEKLALPQKEQERAATSSFSKAKNASWQEFDRGHIYDYRESVFSEWETYAIWDKSILKDYSSAGYRGFPTQDTQEDGLHDCTSGIVYQRFENKLVSLLDDKRERDLNDNLSFARGEFARRNDNLVCAFLVSHKTQRHVITDQEAHISVLNFIRSHNLNNSDFIKDIFVVFVGRTSFLEEGLAKGIPSYEEPTQMHQYSSRGVASYDTFSDTGFHEFLRDSKYVNTTSEFDIDPSIKRSNQLYHVSGGTAIGYQARICSLAFDGVLLHESVTGWVFGTPANENGGSMEDLLLNYLSAFESCKLQNRTQGQIGLINEYNYNMNSYYSNDIVLTKIQEMELTEDMFGNLFHQDNYCNYAIAQALEDFVSSEGSRVNIDPYTRAECFKY